MKKKQRIVLFVFGFFVIVAAVVIAFKYYQFIHIEKQNDKNQIATVNHQNQMALQVNSIANSVDLSKNTIQKISDENFKNWIETEVKNLEIPVKNPIISVNNCRRFRISF